MQRSSPSQAEVTLSLFCVVAAGVLALLYLWSRRDFATDTSAVVDSLLLACFVLLLPLPLQRSQRWWSSSAFLTLIGLVLVSLAGALAPMINLRPLFISAGAVLTIYALLRWLRREPFFKAVLFLLLPLLAGMALAGTIWEGSYLHPLFPEALPLGGAYMDRDTLFHASFTSMFEYFGVPATGLDGIPFTSYHFGAYILFSQLSRLLSIAPLTFLQMTYPILMMPLVLKSLGSVALTLQGLLPTASAHGRLLGNWWFWGLILFGALGFLPYNLQMAMVIPSTIVSQTNVVGIIIGLLLIGLIVALLRDVKARQWQLNFADQAMFLLGIPLVFAYASLAKISVGFPLLMMGGYAFWRVRLYVRRPILIGMGVSVVLFGVVYMLTNSTSGSYPSKPMLMAIIATTVPLQYVAFWHFLSFFWTLLFVGLKCRQLNLHTLGDVRTAFRERRMVDAEALVVAAVLGSAPAFLLDIPGGSGYYFVDVQNWIAVAFLMSGLAGVANARISFQDFFLRRIWNVRLRTLALNVVGAALALLFVTNTLTIFAHFVTHDFAIRSGLAHLSDEQQTAQDFIVALTELAGQPASERRNALVYIPPTLQSYWNGQTCDIAPFVAPAVSGFAQIEGLSSECTTLNPNYWASIRWEQAYHPSADLAAVCRRAQAMGFESLLIMTDDPVVAIERYVCP
ncbi:MAG: hypothetical protein IAE80_06780 [Anaerolinea sp.]|nr:hypothetical protein [Anaerolinea sp.]